MTVAIVVGAGSGAHALPDEGLGQAPVNRMIAERLDAEGPIVVDGVELSRIALRDLYRVRLNSPLWIVEDGPLPRATDARKAIHAAMLDGLNPADYHAPILDDLVTRSADRTVESLVDLELALSDGLMRLAADLRSGRLDPREIDPTFDYEDRRPDVAALTVAASVSGDVGAFMSALAPRHDAYLALRRVLQGQRAVAAAGGWPSVPAGETIEPGEEGAMVPSLRARLAATGEFGGDATDDSLIYDPALAAAVERFQARHGLTVDGIVGPRTLSALNMPVERRIDQILATLERWRWMPHDLGQRHILVNLPDYRMEVVENGQTVRDMAVVVGRRDRQTPLFSSELSWLEFNPTWTIPISIAIKDILPKLIEDPTYLETQNMVLYSGWHNDAAPIPAAMLNWSEVGSGIRYFRVRQDPGPDNSLGKVKFMMANNFSIYLHDTPNRNLFARTHRAYSSGCVRVEDPIWLADHLLEGAAEWTATRRQTVLEGLKTTRVVLPDRVPVHLAYVTVWLDRDGRVQYRGDMYGIDERVADALRDRSLPARQVALAN
ncbi:MAG: L,D-transpeptidase family protein [Inquilinaceae bacterium]